MSSSIKYPRSPVLRSQEFEVQGCGVASNEAVVESETEKVWELVSAATLVLESSQASYFITKRKNSDRSKAGPYVIEWVPTLTDETCSDTRWSTHHCSPHELTDAFCAERGGHAAGTMECALWQFRCPCRARYIRMKRNRADRAKARTLRLNGV